MLSRHDLLVPAFASHGFGRYLQIWIPLHLLPGTQRKLPDSSSPPPRLWQLPLDLDIILFI